MLKIFRYTAVAALVAATPSIALAGDVKVSLNRGLVTVVAEDVPVSRILSEWARVGQVQFVNGDKLMTVVSLQLVDVPERQALDVLLRSASGYMAAERPVGSAGASAFDRVMILPFSRPPAAPPVVNAPPQQMFNPRPMVQQPIDDDPVMPPGMAPGQPGMNPNATQMYPGPATAPAGNQQQNQQNPQQPLTSPRPGFLPPPTGPQQPVPFGSPTPVPPKPPGGGGGGPGGDRD